MAWMRRRACWAVIVLCSWKKITMPTNAVVASDSSSWHLSHPTTSTVYRQHSSTPRRLKQRQRRTRNSTPKQQAASSSNFTCPTTLGLPLLGDSINVVVVTDIHGWIAGQHARHEPQLDVDFGDLVSFYERLQECSSGSDWFLLFNGYDIEDVNSTCVSWIYLKLMSHYTSSLCYQNVMFATATLWMEQACRRSHQSIWLHFCNKCRSPL